MKKTSIVISILIMAFYQNVFAQNDKLNTLFNKDSIDKVIANLTLEEKASLCVGNSNWKTQEIKRLGIPSVFMTDGPHGLRINEGFDMTKPSVKATCFPTASLVAATWNKDLVYKLGQALGDEASYHGVHLLLGPGVNIKRSPLGGRNFEYFSEDPILAGKLAASYINGVQSKGVGTSIKHFAANNQEFERMIMSSEVDERTLREIYFPAFEIAIKESQPTSVMLAYNKLNGVYCTENEWLIKDILRKDFGFRGLCVSDWGAVNDRISGIKAGLDLQMPSDGGGNARKIVDAVKSGQLDEKQLDLVVKTNLELISKLTSTKNNKSTFDKEANHQLAKEIAIDGMVLLKNKNAILPIDKNKKQKVAVIGLFAKSPRFQGAGSSLVNPSRLESFYDTFSENKNLTITYADGYTKNGETNDTLINEAIAASKKSDITIVFAGLTDDYESEGIDRTFLEMPVGHNKLIEKLTNVSSKVIVVLQNGSPVTMPWLPKTSAVLEAYLGGQAGGSAIADVILGKANPSGKLAETFPQKVSHTPTFLSWQGENRKLSYNERIFVGYRYYDMKEIEPLFPFGYGLSYTNFKYSTMKLSNSSITDSDSLQIEVSVRNIGNYDGKEVAQLYVRDIESNVIRPMKELKGFEKVALKKGEEKSVVFTLKPRDFQYYDTKYKAWKSESGQYEIMVGSSSRDIRLSAILNLTCNKKYYQEYNLSSTMKDITEHPIGAGFVNAIIQRTNARYAIDEKMSALEKDAAKKQRKTNEATLMELPLKKVILLSAGSIPESKIMDLLNSINNDIRAKTSK